MKAQPKSGAVVLSDDLKNPAMEKLDLVRKWSINTYKVILSVLDLFLCPSSTLLRLSALCLSLCLLSVSRMLADEWTIPKTHPHKWLEMSFALNFLFWLHSVWLSLLQQEK